MLGRGGGGGKMVLGVTAAEDGEAQPTFSPPPLFLLGEAVA